MSRVFQEERRGVGLTRAPAFGREPPGHGWAERVIRTRKENLRGLTTFATREALRVARRECQPRDHEPWLMGRHRDKTPLQVRQEQQAARAPQVA